MKKIALILLTCIYSFATMGFSIKQFYCCGTLKSVSVTILQDSQQNCGKGNEKSGCCNNNFKFFKVKDQHVTADAIGSPINYFIDLHSSFPAFQDYTIASKKDLIACRSNAPPVLTGVSTYIYNCVFRI